MRLDLDILLRASGRYPSSVPLRGSTTNTIVHTPAWHALSVGIQAPRGWFAPLRYPEERRR